MEELFPSEIARLVLGYLKENKCEKSWKVFLEESSNLQEYCQLYKSGKLYPTNVNGKSLLDILNEYCTFKSDAGSNQNNEISESTFKEKCKIILEEVVTNAVENVLLKYFPSIGDKSQQKDSSQLHATTVIHTSELRSNNCIEYGNTARRSEKNNCTNNDAVEASSLNCESNIELNVTDCSIDQSSKPSGSEVNSLSLIESSVSDSIYLQDIIKVEKDNDSYSILENSPEKNLSDIRSQDMKQKEMANNIFGCYNDPNSSKNKSKVVLQNLSDVDSVCRQNKSVKIIGSEQPTEPMEVEIIKAVKLEPDSKINCNENELTCTNCFQNSSSVVTSQDDSSTVETGETALCGTQSNVSQFNNLVNSINFSTDQSGFALQTTPFSSQSVTVNDLSFSSVPTYIVPNYSSNGPYMQNNAPYSFVINSPTPWKEATVGGFSLNLPSIQSNNIGPLLTSIDSVRSNNTSSVPSVCVNNTLSSALTAVDPVVMRNTPSAPGISITTISGPALTTTDTTVGGQSLTIPSIPSNVSSFVNATGTINSVPKSHLVTSDNGVSKSTGKSNKCTSYKRSGKRKSKSDLFKGKKMKNKELQDTEMSGGKKVRKQPVKKLLNFYQPLCSVESRMKRDTSDIPNNANSQLQRRLILPKTTRRKGK